MGEGGRRKRGGRDEVGKDREMKRERMCGREGGRERGNSCRKKERIGGVFERERKRGKEARKEGVG